MVYYDRSCRSPNVVDGTTGTPNSMEVRSKFEFYENIWEQTKRDLNCAFDKDSK